MFENLDFLYTPKNGNKLRERYFEIHYPSYLKIIKDYTSQYQDMPFHQRFWHLFHQKPDKPKCPTCSKEIAVFRTFTDGYTKYCDSRCQLLDPGFQEAQQKRNLEKYGVKSTNSLSEVGRKRAIAWKAKEHEILAKANATIKERYGVSNISKIPGVKEKTRQTYLARYGVDHNMRSLEGFQKQQKSALRMKNYKESELIYQGSYEFYFLEEFEKITGLSKLLEVIKNPPTIKYTWNEKELYYFPDFLISPYNALIEIKSSWTYSRSGADLSWRDKNEAKHSAAWEAGFPTFLVVDKPAVKRCAEFFAHQFVEGPPYGSFLPQHVKELEDDNIH